MAQKTLRPARMERIKFGIAGVIAILFTIAMVSWGGAIQSDKAAAFWLGVATLLVTAGGFAYAFWYLLVRPLPARHRMAMTGRIKATHHQAIALLLAMAGVNIVVGAFWDELWHRLYGLPFGEDFFWRPHLLMYFGFVAVIALGAAGFYVMVRQMKGSLAQRFRAAPTMGLLVLVAAFMLYALPADPIWHQIYGNDLTAWSIPHLLLLLMITTVMLVAAAIQLSMAPVREWRSLARITAYDLLPLLIFATIVLINLQLFTTEYDNAGAFASQVLRVRPEWVLPVLIAGVAAFAGTLANHSLRTYGAATASGLIAWALRAALIQAFDAQILHMSGWIVALLPLVAIDIWYAYCVLRKRTPNWMGSGVTGALGMLAAYPLFISLFPHFTISNLPLMGVMVLLASLCASWLGVQTGDYVGTSHKQVSRAAIPMLVPVASAGALLALALFILFFINTATPPL